MINSLNLEPEKNASEWHGIVDLEYAKINESTQLIKAYSQAPFKIQRSFYPEGKEICQSVILHTAGGIVGGDRLSQQINLQSETKVLLTTASASKIYRSNGKTAQQSININIQENACLEFLPRETIVFDQAMYRQDLKVNLAPSAIWLGWEIVRFGRSARGEKFIQGQWHSNTEIWQNNCPLWIDRQGFIASEEHFNHPHSLAGQPVVATLSWVGQSVSEEMIEKTRQLWHPQDNFSQAGVTQLISGLLCRYRGNSTQEVINWFTDVWQLLRQNYAGQSIAKPRVWQI